MNNASKKLNAAEIQFKKTQHAVVGKKTMTDYEANGIAVGKKTEQLKALRLARDAAEALANPPAPAKKKSGRKAKKTPENAGLLSEWWKNQSEDGHNN